MSIKKLYENDIELKPTTPEEEDFSAPAYWNNINFSPHTFSDFKNNLDRFIRNLEDSGIVEKDIYSIPEFNVNTEDDGGDGCYTFTSLSTGLVGLITSDDDGNIGVVSLEPIYNNISDTDDTFSYRIATNDKIKALIYNGYGVWGGDDVVENRDLEGYVLHLNGYIGLCCFEYNEIIEPIYTDIEAINIYSVDTIVYLCETPENKYDFYYIDTREGLLRTEFTKLSGVAVSQGALDRDEAGIYFKVIHPNGDFDYLDQHLQIIDSDDARLEEFKSDIEELEGL